MTQSELKELKAIGAELGAAKAENDRLRGLLERIATIAEEREHGYATRQHGGIVNGRCANKLVAMLPDIHATLSQQPEPTDTYTAVDMATAAAQGFRDGQAAVEQAPAQDEREAFQLWRMARGWDDPITPLEVWNAALRYATTRPAQAEQQPVAWMLEGAVGGSCLEFQQSDLFDSQRRYGGCMVPLYAAPIAQTAPQPEQSGLVEALRTEALGLCDVVEKINSLSPVTYALQAGRAINKVRDAAAALSAQWTAEQ